MMHVLARRHRSLLASFLARPVLVGLDYDGTLAPIQTDPARAAVPPRTLALLRRVAAQYPCAVITGRARADVARRLRGVPVRAIVGNHGLEWGDGRDRRWSLRALTWSMKLRIDLGDLRGVMIENKGPSLAVHYRQAARPSRARAHIERAVAGLRGARVVPGKYVVNVLPGVAGKGKALVALRRRLGCPAALFVGDDVTDESAFALARTGRVLGIRVGRTRRSAARFFLRSCDEVDDLLALLLDLAPRR